MGAFFCVKSGQGVVDESDVDFYPCEYLPFEFPVRHVDKRACAAFGDRFCAANVYLEDAWLWKNHAYGPRFACNGPSHMVPLMPA